MGAALRSVGEADIRISFSVKQLYPAAQIYQADPVAGATGNILGAIQLLQHLPAVTGTVIPHLQSQLVPLPPGIDPHSGLPLGRKRILDAVLHKAMDHQRRDIGPIDILSDLLPEHNTVAVADIADIHIVSCMVQFLPELDSLTV